MRRLINTWVALSFLLLPAGCADDADEPAGESAAGTGDTGGSAKVASSTGGNAKEASGTGGSARQGASGTGRAAGQGASGTDRAAGQGGVAGTGGSGRSGGASCQVGKAVVSGTVGATTVGESYSGVNGFAEPYDSDDLALSLGDEGRAYVRPASAAPDGQTVAATGLLQLPPSDGRARTFVCAGEGSTVTLADADGSGWRAHLASLSQLGTCAGGTPVAGEVSITLGDGSEAPKLVSTLQGASFTVPVSNVALLGHVDRPGVVAEVFTDLRPGVAFFSFEEAATAPLDDGAYFIIPDGSPDAGAVYCVGAGSTVTMSGSGQNVLLEAVTLRGLRRLGTCPGAAAGELDICARPSVGQQAGGG
ncbi:MAG TPA: hypothetical protein VFS43_05445 [Polyangiaceae bacterium]|nr:hypothetical protein [Polyangiaceae bacterium]